MRCVAEPLEELVLGSVLAAANSSGPGYMGSDVSEEVSGRSIDLLKMLAETQHTLAIVDERYLEGDVTRDSYLQVRNRHQKLVQAIHRDLAAIYRQRLPENAPGSEVELRQWWQEATLGQKRSFLRLFITEVRVHPAAHRGARFSAERATIVWLRRETMRTVTDAR